MALSPEVPYGEVMLPYCDFHKLYRQKVYAEYFGVTTEGITAHMCGNCFQDFGVGLGNGLGHRLDEGISE